MSVTPRLGLEGEPHPEPPHAAHGDVRRAVALRRGARRASTSRSARTCASSRSTSGASSRTTRGSSGSSSTSRPLHELGLRVRQLALDHRARFSKRESRSVISPAPRRASPDDGRSDVRVGCCAPLVASPRASPASAAPSRAAARRDTRALFSRLRAAKSFAEGERGRLGAKRRGGAQHPTRPSLRPSSGAARRGAGEITVRDRRSRTVI